MDEKPGKLNFAVIGAVVLASSALMAWALISAFNADTAQWEGTNSEDFADDNLGPLEPGTTEQIKSDEEDRLNEETADNAKTSEPAVTPAPVQRSKFRIAPRKKAPAARPESTTP